MVDKADSRCHIAEAPQKQGGAGGSDSEIEITPQMIEAGWLYQTLSCATEAETREFYSGVYRAMSAAASKAR